MEYKVVKNNLDGFWEDKKTSSFGFKTTDDKTVTLTLRNDILQVKSLGIEVNLHREGKVAKISEEGQLIKGRVKEKDEVHIGDQAIIELISTKQSFKIKLPKVNWNLWVGILILLILMIIIFTGWKKRTETKIENDYQKVMSEIKDNIDKADNIKSIDPETSLKLLNQSKDKIMIVKTNKKHEAEIKEIDKKIQDKLAVTGSNEVVGFTEVYDTKIADTVDRKYNKLAVFGSSATLIETGSGKIIKVNLENKSIDGSNAGENTVLELATGDNKFFVYDNNNQIWNIGPEPHKKIVIDGNEVFSKIAYWNKSWYLLGQDGKISKTVDGKINQWTDNKAELINKPVGISIDGTVWVVGQNGEVQDYERGLNKKWAPSIKIVNEDVVGITTTADSQRLAIVSNKKVYVFEKNSGKLIASYNFEKVGIIDAKMGSGDQIFVLAKDQKIYKVK